MDMGETLRLAREKRGLSLDGLAQRTKIPESSLRAIEANDIDRLPAGIFLRGFLKAYAREVGLDADDAVAHYIAQFKPPEDKVEEGTATRSTDQRCLRALQRRWVEESVRERSTLGLAAIVVLAMSFAYVTVRQPQPTAQNDVAGTAAPAAAAVSSRSSERTSSADDAPPSTPGGQTPPAGLPEPVATSGQSIQVVNVTIETVGPCWVSATVDGRTVVYRLMQAGERQTLEGGKEVLLRVGDPSRFTYAINGAGGKSLGRAGVPATVHVTAANYRDFMAGPATP